MKTSKKRIALLCLAAYTILLLAACGPNTPAETTGSATASTQPSLPEHWSATETGLSFDGETWDSYYFSGETVSDQDFQYAADVTFADGDAGLAALVFQSNVDHDSCYVASLSALTDRAELYKVENGQQIPLGKEVAVEEQSSYHMQITMIDSHIAFFVDDTLICSTGDYIMAQDLGQNDVLMSGLYGLCASDGAMTFENTALTVYDAGSAPVLTGLTLQAQSGEVEQAENMLSNGWYVYQQYVSSDCDTVTIQTETAGGAEAMILSATGETVTGPAALNPGQNQFQIFTSTDGQYQLAYRLNILRRGEEEYYTEQYRDV